MTRGVLMNASCYRNRLFRTIPRLSVIVIGAIASLTSILRAEAPQNALGIQTVSIAGGGAYLPGALLKTWVDEYRKTDPSIRLDYRAVAGEAAIHDVSQGRAHLP